MNAKILVAYHKVDELIKDDVYTPVFLGKAVKNITTKDGSIKIKDSKELDKLLGDDTGDNISKLNRNFNEMTAIYWAWKNYDRLGNPEYIGLVHYRRQFIFKDDEIESPEWLTNSNVYKFDYFDEQVRDLINAKYLKKILEKYDGVTSYLYDLHNLNNLYVTCRDRFIEMVHLPGDIYDVAMKYINDNLTEYKEDLRKFQSDAKNYLCNMFVFKKEDFFEYAEFVFSVLKEINAHKELYENCDNIQKRAPGFICEWLTTIYIYHAQRQHSRNFKECRLSFIDDTCAENRLFERKLNEIKHSIIYIACFAINILTLRRIKFSNRRNAYKQELRQIGLSASKNRHSKLSVFIYKAFNKIAAIGRKIDKIFKI